MGRDRRRQTCVKPAWAKPIVAAVLKLHWSAFGPPQRRMHPRSLGKARSQGQRQSSRLRGVLPDVLSVRYRRCHAVQGQPRHQNQRHRDQQSDELSERRHGRALQDNGPSILNDIRCGNSPILVSDEKKKRTRHDEPELPALCVAHEFPRRLVGLETRSLPSLPWLPLRGCERCVDGSLEP